MWFLGLLFGALLGSAWGGDAALGGAFIGALLGILWQRRSAGGSVKAASPASSSALEQRVRTLEAQVDWLHRESVALRAELARLATPGVEAAQAEIVPPTQLPEQAAPVEPQSPDHAKPAVGPAPTLVEAETVMQAAGQTDEFNTTSAAPPKEPAWWSRLLAGNLLAKIGVVLLFFGVASGLRLAAEYGLMPVSLRLVLGAVAGVAMVVFGALRGRDAAQRLFGLALQGGGFAILYLIVYFMLSRYAMLGGVSAFGLFAALGVACVLLAVRQDGQQLAVFGIAGAFLAPVLAASGGGDPRLLFAYFTLLNILVLGVGWFRSWRALNVAGFVLTLIVGMAWAIEQYRPQHYAVTQGFLVLFCLMYSLASPLTALWRAPGWKGWGEGTLVFGTPLTGSFLQAALLGNERYGMAWSALLASLYYLALWLPLYRRSEPEIRLLERSHLGIAIAFLTLAVPLAFGAQVTSALWAVEGVAVLWFGVQRQRRLAQGFGVFMQLAAGLSFLDGMPGLRHYPALFNDVCLGGYLIALAGLFGARLLQRLQAQRVAPCVPPALLLGWALLWWFGIAWEEIERFAPVATRLPLLLLYATLSSLALEWFGAARQWSAPRAFAALLLPLLFGVAAVSLERQQHVLAGLLALAVPLAFAAHYWMLARQEKAGLAFFTALRHVAAFWLIVAVAGVELAWVAQRLAPGVSLWPLLAQGLLCAGFLALSDSGVRQERWPFAAQAQAYIGAVCLPLALLLVCWSLFANLTHAGGGSGLPYLPLLNPFDLTQLAALAVLRRWLGEQSEEDGSPVPGLPMLAVLRCLPALLAFVWISMLAARMVHHWAGVPFAAYAMFHSALLQGVLTLLWSAGAIGLMIRATRCLSRRGWYAGFALLALVGAKLLFVDLANAGTVMWTGSLIGVALLVLAAAYFAPAPPESGAPDDLS